MPHLSLLMIFVFTSFQASAEPFEQVQKWVSKERPEKALSSLKAIIEGEQADDIKGLALVYSGILSYREGRYEQAREALEKSLLKPIRISDYARYYLGLSQLKLGQLSAAKNQLEIVQSQPGSPFVFEARLELAQIAQSEGNWKIAAFHLDKLERRYRSHIRYPDVIWNLMLVNRKLNRKWVVCKLAQKIYAKYPSYTQAQGWGIDLQNNKLEGERLGCTATLKDQQMRIRRLQWNGLSDRARQEINTLETRTTPGTQYLVDRMLAQFLVNEGYVEEGLKVYLKHYQAESGSMSYLVALGTAAARAGEMQTAVGAYYRAYKMGMRSVRGRQALFQAAFLSYRFQDYDGAGRKFEELIERYPTSGLSRDARWHLAWIKYLKGDYAGAHRSFQVLNSRKGRRPAQDVTERMRYWMAMSLLKMGQTEKAREEFVHLAADPLIGYYAVAAKYRLGKMGKGSVVQQIPEPSSEAATPEATTVTEAEESEETLPTAAEEASEPEEVEAGAEPEESVQPTVFADATLAARFDRARDLRILGLEDRVKNELFEIERRTRNPLYMRMLITEYETSQVWNRSSTIGQIFFSPVRAKQGLAGARSLWEAAYPRAYPNFVTHSARAYSVPEELVWGIMRAESQYRADVSSPVGALGLMQLMPFTARQVSNLLGEEGFQTQLLLKPEVNIRLGTRYLKRLSDKFSRHIPLIAAGYNAGPHRVREWLYSFGHLEMDEFIEHIPFVETRNYVKKVVRFYETYQELYSKERDSLSYMAGPIEVKITAPPSFRESWD